MAKRTILIIAILFLFACACSAADDASPQNETGESIVLQQLEQHEGLCFKFLSEQMVTADGGFRTNYLDKMAEAELATGADVLSESMGLWMLYAAEIRDSALFGQSLQFVERYLDTGKILSYRYSPENGAYHVNAFVDDIRIIRALLLADDAFGGYLDMAKDFADRLYQTNVKDGYVFDFYDEQYGMTNDFVTLCYIDFDTMRMLGEQNGDWLDVYENMLAIVSGGYLGEGFPMYEGSYRYATKEYADEDIVTVQSLLTVLNLARIGECPQNAVDFIKQRLADGALYGAYDRNGKPVGHTESTAIYAICAQIAQTVHDEGMYEDCIERMNRYQVTDRSSEVYGAFANAETMDLYAFDNLMALLAYRSQDGV